MRRCMWGRGKREREKVARSYTVANWRISSRLLSDHVAKLSGVLRSDSGCPTVRESWRASRCLPCTDLRLARGGWNRSWRSATRLQDGFEKQTDKRMIERVSPTISVHFSPRWVSARTLFPPSFPPSPDRMHMLAASLRKGERGEGEEEEDKSVECFWTSCDKKKRADDRHSR